MSDEVTTLNTANLVRPSIMQPTLRFRWVHRWVEGKVLQQLWTDINNGDEEWKDVPEEEE